MPVETWTYETPESVETTLRHHLADAVRGAEPGDLAAVHARMERAICRAIDALTNVGRWPGPVWLNGRTRTTSRP